MKRKFLTVLLTLIASLCLCFGLVACDNKSGNGNNETTDSTETDLWTIERVYATAKELGFGGTLEDLIAEFKGEDGKDGKDGKDGVDGKDGLDGKDGKDGIDGKDGKDGKDGLDGADGKDGIGVRSVEIDEDGHLKVTLTDGTVLDAGKVIPDEPAEEGTEGLQFQKIKGKDGEYTAMVTGIGTAWETDIVIPATYRGLKVTAIANNAFHVTLDARNYNLTSVEIPDSVTVIGDEAFRGCNLITNINMSDNVTEIGAYAFSGCSALTEIKLPRMLQTIGEYAFRGCDSITSIEIPDSVVTIGGGAFESCYCLVEVWNYSDLQIAVGREDNGLVAYYAKQVYTTDKPSKQTLTEEGYLFYEDEKESLLIAYCGNETKLILPAMSPKERDYKIYQYAFCDCTFLNKITIPDRVTEIGNAAFSNCNSLTSVKFEDNGKLSTIGMSAFSNCSQLTRIEIPNGVTSIGPNAFAYCCHLTRIEIPEGVTLIGDSAFISCVLLTDIQYKGTVEEWTSIEKNAWDFYTNTVGYTITCRDGKIDNKGNVTYFE